MSRSIAEVTGRLPFAGKHLAKYWYQKGREASRNGEITGKLVNAAALGAFAVGHAMQFKMGITELTHDANQNPIHVGIDALYTTANGIVTYTQAYLAARVLTTPEEAKLPVPVTSEGGLAYDSTSSGERPDIKLGRLTPTEFAVTLGGQALFMATMR